MESKTQERLATNEATGASSIESPGTPPGSSTTGSMECGSAAAESTETKPSSAGSGVTTAPASTSATSASSQADASHHTSAQPTASLSSITVSGPASSTPRIRTPGTGLNRAAHAPDELEPRARQILRAVIHEYVNSGEPVPSSSLAGQPGIEISPASVRSVLADLEALGYLDKPHTSAGRVPTEKGFRFYADVLVRLRPVGARDRGIIDSRYDPSKGLAPSDLRVADTSLLLHTLTRYAGIATTPRHDEVLRTIEFVQLRENRVLAVMVTGSGAVRNRLLLVDTPLPQEQLDSVSGYLNELLGGGRTLTEVRQLLAAELESERALYDRLLSQALVLGARALDATDPRMPQVVVEGETALIGEPTLSESVEQLRRLFRALEKKTRISELLARAAAAGELMLFIGEETGLGAGAGLTVIASPYGRDGETLGAVGVVGPSRMAYGRVIPIVEYTAQALSRSLEQA